ncbi:hypothetical protein BD311DRAFT_766581, partial [Dichomitus squalens]
MLTGMCRHSKRARVRTEGARVRLGTSARHPRPTATDTLTDEDAGEASTNNPELKRDSDCERTKEGPGLPNGQSADASLGLGLTLSYGKEHHEHEHDLDGATASILLTESSQHPPPPGVDQVSPGTWASSRGGG